MSMTIEFMNTAPKDKNIIAYVPDDGFYDIVWDKFRGFWKALGTTMQMHPSIWLNNFTFEEFSALRESNSFYGKNRWVR